MGIRVLHVSLKMIYGKALDSFNIQEQIWKPVKGFEKFYQVSNFGRIRSLKRTRKVFGNKQGVYQGKILLPCVYKDFLMVCLINEDKKHNFRYAHRLVYQAFIGNIPENALVLHKDLNKMNNTPENLQIRFYENTSQIKPRPRKIYKCKQTGQIFKNPSKFLKKRNLNISLYIFKRCVRNGEKLPGTCYHIGEVKNEQCENKGA